MGWVDLQVGLGRFLANVNSLYVVVRPSVVCLSVTFVQAIQIFGNVSTQLVPWPSLDIQVKIYRDRPRGTPQRER